MVPERRIEGFRDREVVTMPIYEEGLAVRPTREECPGYCGLCDEFQRKTCEEMDWEETRQTELPEMRRTIRRKKS